LTRADRGKTTSTKSSREESTRTTWSANRDGGSGKSRGRETVVGSESRADRGENASRELSFSGDGMWAT